MRVVVLDCRITDDVNQARVARVSLRVEKAGTKPAPVLGLDSLGGVLDAADRLLTAAQSAYAEYRFMRAAADFIIESFKASVMGIAGAIEGALSNAGQVGGAAGSVSALASVNDAAIVSDTAVPLAVASAARDVSALAGGRAALTRGADAAPQAAFAALDALNAQELVKAPTAPATTPARQQLVAANEGLGVLAVAIFAGEFARAAAAVQWASRDEAMAARDKVSDALAAAADRVAAAGWDAVWQRLVALRAASAADLAERAAPLPRIKRLELPGVMPATLIAYRLDGDSLPDVFGRGAALSARNRVRHPGFVPAAQPIEVLA
jgi:prophage DNA circulation protein